jgi:acyl-CoA dehydrogenase
MPALDPGALSWPFFDAAHQRMAAELEEWAAGAMHDADVHPVDLDATCRSLVARLGEAGWLRYVAPAAHGGLYDAVDVRSLCLIRETLAYHAPLADVAFAMQGLGAAPIARFGDDALKARYLPRVAAGAAIAAFAVSEPDAGSDLSAMKTTGRPDGDAIVLDGCKTWISNGGIADFYVVFFRRPDLGDRAFGAVVVDAATPGLHVRRRIDALAPHPLAELQFEGCRAPASAQIGSPDGGLRVALATLETFRPTVGAAALGMARRAYAEAAAWCRERRVFGEPLGAFQMTQARLADMSVELDASALLVYRAAWARDQGAARTPRESAAAKLYATEAAQRIIDGALQLLGARGLVAESTVGRLYREVRALRIYEGASEVQKLIIADALGFPGARAASRRD